MDAAQVYNEWKNRIVVDSAGEKIGSVEDVYLDRDTQQPEWALVSMGLFGSRHTLVPLTDVQVNGNRVQLPYDSEQVRNAPSVEPQGELSEEQEQALYRHYNINASTAASSSLLPSGEASATGAEQRGVAAEPATGRASGADGGTLQLAEEEVQVHKTPAEVGQVRLGKQVLTERRQLDVPVQREVLVLEHRQVRRRPTQTDAIGESPEVVIALKRDHVEIEKRPLVREEVAVSKRSVEETQHVETDVQREVPRFEREGDLNVTGAVPEEELNTAPR